jgi:small subunit ribosomal protein S1
MIHISDMSEDMAKHPADLVSVGQKLDVMVLRIKKAQRKIKLGLKQLSDSWSSVETKYAAGQKVKGKVIRFKNNGVIVELEPGVAGFVHATEISWSTQKKAPSEAFTPGQEVMAVVLEINVRKKRMSLSIRQLETDPWLSVEAKYSIGTKVTSTAYKLMPFGALVELDGCIGGLVHVSDMSWLRKIKHPSEFLTKGDEIEAVVLRVDQANRRLALGIKQLVRDPWETIDQLYKVGDHVAGKVVKLTGFGAFVELSHEFQGLVHMSRISEQPVDDVKNVLQVGQEVSVRIINIDRDERRIGLSMLAT